MGGGVRRGTGSMWKLQPPWANMLFAITGRTFGGGGGRCPTSARPSLSLLVADRVLSAWAKQGCKH